MAENEARASEEVFSDEIVEATVRRAPKYGVFLTIGAALGVLVAMIATFTWTGTGASGAVSDTGIEYSQVQIFGFVALITVSGGLALGGLVALIFDRTIGRRTQTVTVDRERVVETPEAPASEAPAAE